jgi:hypothetical protein
MSRRVPGAGRPTKRRQPLRLVGTSNGDGKHAPEPSSATPPTAGAAVPPPVDPPGAGDRFPHDRPAALTLGHLSPALPSRRMLAGISNGLIAIYCDAINELREIAVLCRARNDAFNEIGAQRAVASLSLKAVEQAQGKKLTMDVNVRSQEDLVPWHSLSDETRALLEAGWEAAEREHAALAEQPISRLPATIIPSPT